MPTFAQHLDDTQETRFEFGFDSFAPNIRDQIIRRTFLANEFNVLWQNAEKIVLFIGENFALGVNPSAAIAALHHFHIVVVVFVAFLTKWTEISFLTKSEAVAAHWKISDELCHVCCAARFTLETRRAD